MSKTTAEDNMHPAVKALHWLIPCALLLIPLHYFSKFIPEGYVRDLLNIGKEANLPTLFAFGCWFLTAAASVVAYHAEGANTVHAKGRWIWLLISISFLFAATDEFVQFHEHIHEIWQLIQGTGATGFGGTGSGCPDWNKIYAMPALILAGVGGWFCWNRMKGARMSRAYLVAGISCLVLAFGCEFLEAAPQVLVQIQHNEFFKQSHLLWVLEETLENVGGLLIGLAITRYANKSINQALQRQGSGQAESKKTAGVS